MKSPEKKKKTYTCKYQNAWEVEFKWIRKSEKGLNFAFCICCRRDFSVSHAGKNDVKKHCSTDLHSRSVKQSKLPSVTDFVLNRQDEEVIKCETLFANFIAEHNLPFIVADHFTRLCKIMFPDSKIAQKFSCSRTKTTQIVKRAIAPCLTKVVVEHYKAHEFSLCIDESNDKNSDKNLVILVRIFDPASCMAVTRLLDMPVCNIGTAANIFNQVDEALRSREIPWQNLVSFVSDNCSVMVGRNNSVLSRIRDKNPDVFDLGCVCHLANLSTIAGIKALPLPVEDLLIDIYYHFHHSSKRKELYKEFLEFADVEPLQIIKHFSTRWLSLQKCVVRILHHWPALTSYFNSHPDIEREGRVKRVAEWLNGHEMKLYYSFLSFILGPLNEFNTAFQADGPKIGFMATEIERLLRKFLMKFTLAKVIREADNITSVDYMKGEHQHNDDMIAVGTNTRTYLAEVEDDIDPSVKNKFFRAVRHFYEAVVNKMMKKFPFQDPVLNNLKFLDPEMKDNVTADSVVQLARRFPAIIPADQHDKLSDEFQEFQCSPEKFLPAYEKDKTRIDNYWGKLHALTNVITGEKLYPVLSKLALAMLTIPNSNADCERTFSTVRKVHTELRSDLSNETICALLSCKLNQNCECFQFSPSTHMLTLAKTAAHRYNSSLQSSICDK